MEYDNKKLEGQGLILEIILRICGEDRVCNLLIYILLFYQFIETCKMEESIEI